MRFAYGATRWVILTERYAIKIARFRPIRPLVRLLQLLRKGTVRQELNKYDPNPVRGGLKYLIAGVIANLTEYRLYSQYYESGLLAPTLFTIGGLVNVQLRGEPAEIKDVRQHYLWKVLRGTALADTLLPRQFCLISSTVLLADSGERKLEDALAGYGNRGKS